MTAPAHDAEAQNTGARVSLRGVGRAFGSSIVLDALDLDIASRG